MTPNKIRPLVFTFLFISMAKVHADSDGYGCYTSDYIVYDKALEDSNGLYLNYLGGYWKTAKKPIRIQLPLKHDGYSLGIDCKKGEIQILLRKKVKNKKTGSDEYLMHLIAIDLKNPLSPKVGKAIPDHIQAWQPKLNRRPIPGGPKEPTILPEPTLNFYSHNLMNEIEISPSQAMPGLSHTIIKESSEESKPGLIKTTVKYFLIRKNANGQSLGKTNFLTKKFLETID